ncbi:putative APSES transcription factor Xbp1 [Aspergillus chevalieri]|uniref:HTH APSES-type domain-containing protein n=1 Tax=Aspergillus chevalieri TaxID=182096 RepID=A0A7R7VDD3_ASPCH|nr:uncharacterized protein ACHE_10077S [Aspergillus chevalieri]BCR82675.1 hypothetical protein ACHE_10077S [Aspergillus chevalieri]
MSTIQSLLNPLPDQQFPFTLPSPSLPTPRKPKPDAAPTHSHKKQKSKGLPRKKGPIRGELRYPPYEERDDGLASIHREFRMEPMGGGNIRERPWHVPYNSDKKTFQHLTGRDSLEVFYYQFKLPGQAESEEPWWVMWDYNIGLVRMTHLFKSNGHSKTTIGKAMKANPGLPEISHSITGGATEAQGYWVPFDAAKALAATFCYKIRHVLVPLFGPDFPSLCIHPHDRTRFNRMVIDRSVIQRATQTANYYRSLELRSSPFSTSTNHTPSPNLRPTSSSGSSFVARKKAIPRSRKHASSLSSSTTGTVISGYSSGYGSGVDEYSDVYCVSPVSIGSYRGGNTFTPVNTPRSADVYTSSNVGIGTTTNTGAAIPTPQEVLASITAKTTTNTSTIDEDSTATATSPSASTTDEETSSTAYSEISSSWSDYSFVDIDKDDREYSDSPANEPLRTNRKRKAEGSGNGNRGALLVKEVKAAHALLSLHMQDASGSEYEGESDGDEDVSVPPASSLVGVYQQQQQQIYSQRQSRKRRRASA